MNNVQFLLNNYNQSHKNPINIKIHMVCVPLILWSVLVLLWQVKFPRILFGEPMNLAQVFVAFSLSYYMRLGPKVFASMFVVACIALTTIFYLEKMTPYSMGIGALVFVLAWIGQFYGHKIEGKKPSFLEDLQYLLVGPVWTLSHFIKLT